MLSKTMSAVKPVVLQCGEVIFAKEALENLGNIATVIHDDSANREEFIKNLHGKYNNVQFISRTFASVKQTGLIDKELISHFPESLVSVSNCGAGYDQVDAHALGDAKIQLSNVPEAVDNSTADTHIFLLLGALRSFGDGHHRMLRGEWPSHPRAAGTEIAHDPEGKTVGILGLGGIGRNILKKLQPFGFKEFIYHNRNQLPEELEAGAKYVSFDELLAQSDIISINIPLSKATTHMFNDEVFSKMKKGVVLVNTARGAIIDETALIKALKNGTVRSCGLDVLENEPSPNMELVTLPNVLAIPHMGTHSMETIKKMEEINIGNIESAIKTGKVINLVPEHRSIGF